MVYDAPEFTKGFLFDQRVSYFFSKTGKPFKTVDGKLTIELDAEGKITRLGAWLMTCARADLLQLTSGARRVEIDCQRTDDCSAQSPTRQRASSASSAVRTSSMVSKLNRQTSGSE